MTMGESNLGVTKLKQFGDNMHHKRFTFAHVVIQLLDYGPNDVSYLPWLRF